MFNGQVVSFSKQFSTMKIVEGFAGLHDCIWYRWYTARPATQI